MIIYRASRLVAISDAVHGAELAAWNKNTYTNDCRADVADRMSAIAVEAEFLGLKATVIASDLIAEQVDRLSCEEVYERIQLLLDVFRKETEQFSLFYVPAEKQKYFVAPPPCGEEFLQNFPRANYELWEAGKCLATERYTASVFHAMRALEIALLTMESALGISAPIAGPENTWGRIIGRIQATLARNATAPPANWQNDENFYKTATTFFSGIKISFRDSTMHVKALRQ